MSYKKAFPLVILIFMVLMVSTPAIAQDTAQDVIASGQTEAVQVISSGLADIVLKLGTMLISVVAIFAYALFKSSPPAVQKLIIENGENTLKALKEHTDATINKFDDKVADIAGAVFEAVIQMIEDEQDEDITPPLPPTPIQ